MGRLKEKKIKNPTTVTETLFSEIFMWNLHYLQRICIKSVLVLYFFVWIEKNPNPQTKKKLTFKNDTQAF